MHRNYWRKSSVQYGIFINGPALYAAMFLDQRDGNRKAIQWLGANTGANIYSDPATGDFTIEASGNINLSLKSTFNQGSLSGTAIPANNLRRLGVPVAGNAVSVPVSFAKPETDANYAILIQCSWPTGTAVQQKTGAGFSVVFQNPAPIAGGKLDWVLAR